MCIHDSCLSAQNSFLDEGYMSIVFLEKAEQVCVFVFDDSDVQLDNVQCVIRVLRGIDELPRVKCFK